MTLRTFVIGAALAVAVAAPAAAQVPETGLAAETEGRWTDALHIYRGHLAADPTRADLWMRVADIEAYLGHAAAANVALKEASRCYREMEKQQPTADGTALNLARASAWSGDTDGAVAAYQRALKQHPENEAVWLELARAQSWQGNTAGAVETLEGYRQRFGGSRAYTIARAQVLAVGGRPSNALTLVEPIYREQPLDYDVNLTRTVALTMEHRMPAAWNALTTLRQIGPNRFETRNAERLFRKELGSTIEPGMSFYNDSDNLEITRVAPALSATLHSGTKVLAGYDRQDLRAPQPGGLGQSTGRAAHVDQFWIGGGQMVGPLTVVGRMGSATTGVVDHTPYTIGASVRAADWFTGSAERADEFVIISPKTVELGLTEVRYRTDLEFAPTLRSYIGVSGQFQDLSDGNQRWEVSVNPRFAVARVQHVNFDAGFFGYHLSALKDLPNGYYDPSKYESYNGMLYPYFKFNENNGLGVSIGLGMQRHETDPFRFGGSVSGEGTVGIFRAWVLRVAAAYTNNQRLSSGAFSGYNGSIVLVRRFF